MHVELAAEAFEHHEAAFIQQVLQSINTTLYGLNYKCWRLL